jgi:hypothetical protein
MEMWSQAMQQVSGEVSFFCHRVSFLPALLDACNPVREETLSCDS